MGAILPPPSSSTRDKANELTCEHLRNHQLLIPFKTTCNRLFPLNPAFFSKSDPAQTCLRTHQLFTELILQITILYAVYQRYTFCESRFCIPAVYILPNHDFVYQRYTFCESRFCIPAVYILQNRVAQTCLKSSISKVHSRGGWGCSDNAINNVSACSELFLSTTGLFPARRKILEHETFF